MPNNKKYRVQDIAADIGADRSAVIELLEGAFEGTKKAQTSLTDQEVSYVLEVFSKKGEVKDFDEYFKATADKKTEKPKAAHGEVGEGAQLYSERRARHAARHGERSGGDIPQRQGMLP